MSDEPLDATVEEHRSGEQAVPALPAHAASGEGSAEASRGASWSEVRDNPKLLLSLLFFVTGALGLPLLWYSKAFSVRNKIALSLAVLAWTALLIWGTAWIVMWSYSRVENALQ